MSLIFIDVTGQKGAHSFSWGITFHHIYLLHLFLHLPIDRYLGSFHFLIIMNRLIVNICIKVPCGHMSLFLLREVLGME